MRLQDKIKFLIALFLVSAVVNFAWEMSQAFLYEGMGSLPAVWLHCFVAALGDGVILWLMHLCGWMLLKDFRWFVRAGPLRFGFMALTGFTISLTIEWIAVYQLHRWSYTEQMPMVPWLGVGLVPVMQMVLLPPLIFWLANRIVNKNSL